MNLRILFLLLTFIGSSSLFANEKATVMPMTMMESDLAISMSASSANYSIFQNVEYTITVINQGPATAENVVVDAQIPEKLAYVGHTTSQGDYDLFFQTWSIGTIPAGAIVSFDITLYTLTENEPIPYFAQIINSDQADPDSTPNNNTTNIPNEDDEVLLTLGGEEEEDDTTTPTGTDNPLGSADLEMSINSTTSEYGIFQEVTYTISIRNYGIDVATNVVVAAPLPEGMVFTSADSILGVYDPVSNLWDVGTLAPGQLAGFKLTLYTISESGPITMFTQAWSMDQGDPDATPGNDTDNIADEDDEASLTIFPLNGSTGEEEEEEEEEEEMGTDADLALSITAESTSFGIFQEVNYTISLENMGPDAASNIVIDLPFPENTAYTGSTLSHGMHDLFSAIWTLDMLENGATATMDLTLYTLSEEAPITLFGQVIAVDQADIDSTPANNDSTSPSEDDEAAVTIVPASNFASNQWQQERSIVVDKVYPVPAIDELNIAINSAQKGKVLMQVFGANGQLLMQQSATVVAGHNTLQLQVGHLIGGNYTIQLIQKDGTQFSRQFLK